jgi:sec-independent protein translocase protein TatC
MNKQAPPLAAHLIELRARLLKVLLVVVVGVLVSFLFKEALLELLMWPLHRARPQQVLIFTGVPDVFFTYLKASIYGGIFLAVPVLCYQVWRFVTPGLYREEQGAAWPFLLLTPTLFYAGLGFAYTVVLPLAVAFFFSFETAEVVALPALKDYFSFVLKMLLAFGLAFILPMAVLLLVRLGVVEVATLRRGRRYVIVGLFVLAAVLTPPDPLTQAILAAPLWVMYELAILAARWHKGERKKG